MPATTISSNTATTDVRQATSMQEIKVRRNRKRHQVKMLTTMEHMIDAVKNLDLHRLKILAPAQPATVKGTVSLITGMEMIFDMLKSKGHSRLRTDQGTCGCMKIEWDGAYKAVSFISEYPLPGTSGYLYQKEFSLVFVKDKPSEAYRYFKFCAHMDWKKKHNIFIYQ